MKKLSSVIIFTFFALTAVVGFQNCSGFLGLDLGQSKGTSTGNPSLHLSFAPYGFTAQGITLQKANNRLLAPDQLQNVSVIFCIGELKFKTEVDALENEDGSDNDEVRNIRFNTREIAISPLGTDLDFVEVPAAEFKQVEFKLKPSSACSARKSVVVHNSLGTFSSTETIKLKFNGLKSVSVETQDIQLNIQAIIEALSSVSADDQIIDKIESVFGDLD